MNAHRHAVDLVRLKRGVLVFVGLVMALLLTAGVSLWQACNEKRAIQRMSGEDRSQLYGSTRESVETLCKPAPTDPALLERCRNFASFLLEFPECDADCKALAHSLERQPAR